MATMRVQAKTLPLLRQSFAIWQAKRYLNVFCKLWNWYLFWFWIFSFCLRAINDSKKFFPRCLGLCCCRLSPGFDAISKKKNQGTLESNSQSICVIPKRTLLGSFIPNPLTASNSRRKKYSERRILGWALDLQYRSLLWLFLLSHKLSQHYNMGTNLLM